MPCPASLLSMELSLPLIPRGIALATLVMGCRGDALNERGAASASGGAQAPTVTAQAPDSLRLSLVVPHEVRVGQRVPITLRAENTGARPLELYLRGRTIAFDVVIAPEGGEVVWRRLEGEVIPAILRLEVLAPGQVLELRAEWDQRTNAGARVAAGSYEVRGSLLTDAEPWESPEAGLRIVGK